MFSSGKAIELTTDEFEELKEMLLKESNVATKYEPQWWRYIPYTPFVPPCPDPSSPTICRSKAGDFRPPVFTNK